MLRPLEVEGSFLDVPLVHHPSREADAQSPTNPRLVAKIVDNNALAEIARSEARASLSNWAVTIPKR